MADFEIKLDAAKALAMMNKIGSKDKWMKILSSLVATIGLGDVRDHFRREQGSSGAWPELSRSYAEWKQRKYAGRPKLVLSAHLSKSFLPSNIRREGPDAVALFNPVEYSGMHDKGFKGTQNVPAHTRIVQSVFGKKLKAPIKVNVRAHSKKVDVPQRQFMWLSTRAMDLMEKGLLSQML